MGTKNKPGKYDCLEGLDNDEPYFALRGLDVSSPIVVIEWIKLNFHTCPDDKIREAFELALAMKNYPKKKIAD
jgi:hypothetical protein